MTAKRAPRPHGAEQSCIAMRLPMEGEPPHKGVLVHAKRIFETEMRGRNKVQCRAVRDRPYCCSGGSPVTLVIRQDGSHHFRHNAKPGGAEKNGTEAALSAGTCGCSEEHLLAQKLILEHANSLCVHTWHSCQKHVAARWNAPAPVYACMEKQATHDDRRVRYDTVLRSRSTDERLKVIEVRHKHATDPSTRPPDSIEVSASQVIAESEKVVAARQANAATLLILHNLWVDDSPCAECAEEAKAREVAKRAEAERARIKEAERAETERVRRVQAERAESAKRAEAERVRRVQAERAQEERRRRAAEREAADEAARAAAERAEADHRQKMELERKRQAARDAYELKPTPGYSATVRGITIENLFNSEDTQEEIAARRAARMAREAQAREAREARRRRRR